MTPIGIEKFVELVQIALVLVPLVTGVTVVARQTFNVPKRFVPATSLLIGLVAGFAIVDLSLAGAVAGFVVGLAATGLWENGKKVFEKNEPVKA